MKRRNLIICMLLAATLALGVGYAALSRELIVSSTANLNPNNSDFDIVFTSANTSDADLATASVTGTGTTANYTVAGLSKKDDSVTLTFVVTNQTEDVTAGLTAVSMTPGTLYIGDGTTTPGDPADFFQKDVTITDAEGNEYDPEGEFTVAPGATATVTVVITMKQTITEKVTLEGATIHLNFDSVEE